MSELYLKSLCLEELEELKSNLKRDYEQKIDAIDLQIKKWQRQ